MLFRSDPNDPRRGWGVFGHAGISIGAPAILDWSMTAGIAGSVPIASRPRDRFGIGYFRFSLEDRIAGGLAPILPVGDEQGGEIYYSAQILRMLQLTASAQFVDPVLSNAPAGGEPQPAGGGGVLNMPAADEWERHVRT